MLSISVGIVVMGMANTYELEVLTTGAQSGDTT